MEAKHRRELFNRSQELAHDVTKLCVRRVRLERELKEVLVEIELKSLEYDRVSLALKNANET